MCLTSLGSGQRASLPRNKDSAKYKKYTASATFFSQEVWRSIMYGLRYEQNSDSEQIPGMKTQYYVSLGKKLLNCLGIAPSNCWSLLLKLLNKKEQSSKVFHPSILCMRVKLFICLYVLQVTNILLNANHFQPSVRQDTIRKERTHTHLHPHL